MSEIIDVTDALFSKKRFGKLIKDWNQIPDELKEKWFFIMNRYLSKTFLDKSYINNSKSIDKVSAMNLWHSYLRDKDFPENFWSKSESSKDLSPSDIKWIMIQLELDKESDVFYLNRKHTQIIKEILKTKK